MFEEIFSSQIQFQYKMQVGDVWRKKEFGFGKIGGQFMKVFVCFSKEIYDLIYKIILRLERIFWYRDWQQGYYLDVVVFIQVGDDEDLN